MGAPGTVPFRLFMVKSIIIQIYLPKFPYFADFFGVVSRCISADLLKFITVEMGCGNSSGEKAVSQIREGDERTE